MENNTILVAVIVVLLLVVAFQTLQLVSIRNEIKGVNAGEYQGFSSYEEMMEAHHGSNTGLPEQQGGC